MSKPKKKIAKKLLHKYRLVILNEDTFEERLTFKLSRLNVFVVVGVSSIVLIILTSLLIAFTPLREYIPGYPSPKLRQHALEMVYKTDSLSQVLQRNNRYFASIQRILRGEVVGDTSTADIDTTVIHKGITSTDIDLAPSKADSMLRKIVAHKEKYNVLHPAVDSTNFKLFPPVKGRITDDYNYKTGHYAVDIATEENQPVKATADGTVIFAEWTVATGYVVIVDHGDGLVSVYKHNSTLLKAQGDRVKAGEVIALTGNTGKFSTGPHLHFELWKDGYPIDPSEFIDFQ